MPFAAACCWVCCSHRANACAGSQRLFQLSSAGARTQRGFVDRRENCGVWTARAVVHRRCGHGGVTKLHLQRGEHNALFIGKTDIFIGERAPGMDQLTLLCLRLFMQRCSVFAFLCTWI